GGRLRLAGLEHGGAEVELRPGQVVAVEGAVRVVGDQSDEDVAGLAAGIGARRPLPGDVPQDGEVIPGGRQVAEDRLILRPFAGQRLADVERVFAEGTGRTEPAAQLAQ